MHEAAIDYVRSAVKRYRLEKAPVRILDIGGRRTSTSRYYSGPQPYELFLGASEYQIMDITPGPDVGIVADATDPDGINFELLGIGNMDVVICTEVLEHVEKWGYVIETCYRALRPGGRLILTCAGPGRRPHPATTEEKDPPPGEWYRNVGHLELRGELMVTGFRDILTQQVGQDTQATAVK